MNETIVSPDLIVDKPVKAREFMALLDYRPPRFYELIRSGHIPAPLPMPGAMRWSRRVVTEFLRSGRVVPTEPSTQARPGRPRKVA